MDFRVGVGGAAMLFEGVWVAQCVLNVARSSLEPYFPGLHLQFLVLLVVGASILLSIAVKSSSSALRIAGTEIRVPRLIQMLGAVVRGAIRSIPQRLVCCRTHRPRDCLPIQP